MPFRRVHVRLVAGVLTGGAPSSSRRDVMSRAAEDGRALLEAAKEVHAERHGEQTFLPGTLLPFLEAAKRTGIRLDRQRYYDAIEDLEYEGAIEWDKSARSAGPPRNSTPAARLNGRAPMVKRRCSRRRCGPRLSARWARNGRRKRSARGRPPWLRSA
jgi:hypothetical protein